MTLDPLTVTVLTALVVMVTSVVFIVETVLRKDEGPARVWSLAFLAAVLTVIAYLVWAVAPDVWWSVAIGNAAFVGGTGCIWLGCRVFNAQRMPVARIAVAAATTAALVAVLILGPEGGGWAGAEVMFAAILAFATLGAFESRRGEMGRTRHAWPLSVVLGVQAAYYAVRIVVFVSSGPESELFDVWFGTITTSMLTIILSIVAVVVTLVLLSGRARLGWDASALGEDGVLPEASFADILRDMTGRAEARGDLVGVVAVRIDDLPDISTAFGSEAATAVRRALRTGVRRSAPSSASIGQDGAEGLLVTIQPETVAEARRTATRIQRGLVDELSGVVDAVIPIVGVGVAVSDSSGYDPRDLTIVARELAQQSPENGDASLSVGGQG
ncbi:MAG: hypothetical protein ABWY55_06370 [Microbacterium sp.]